MAALAADHAHPMRMRMRMRRRTRVAGLSRSRTCVSQIQSLLAQDICASWFAHAIDGTPYSLLHLDSAVSGVVFFSG